MLLQLAKVMERESVVVISGGTVIAASVNGGAGIGSGYRGTASSGNKLTGNAVVFATKGKSVSAHIQGFSKSDLTSGVLFEGDTGKVYGNPAIAADVTIPGGKP